MYKLILATFLIIGTSSVFAAELDDRELLSDKIVGYFKKVASETGKPISLKIILSDAFGAGTSIEDEKNLDFTSFPKIVSRSFIMGILEEKSELLHDFMDERDLATLSLKTTIWVNDSRHKEKANGFCSLGSKY